jgi:hypothetical protein
MNGPRSKNQIDVRYFECVVDRLRKGDLVMANEVKEMAGHPRFYELTRQEEDLHNRKNGDYAGGGAPMGNFDRVAAILEMYPGLDLGSNVIVGLVYMLKQLDAVLWLLAQKRDGQVEGIDARLGDIGVYAKLIRIMFEETTAKEKLENAREEIRFSRDGQWPEAIVNSKGACGCKEAHRGADGCPNESPSAEGQNHCCTNSFPKW